MRAGCRDFRDGCVPVLFQCAQIFGAAMSSSPLEWFRDGDGDVTTPFWVGSGWESEGELHGGIFG